MASTRLCLVRVSIVLNAFLVTYLCISWLSSTSLQTDNQVSHRYRTLEGIIEPSADSLLDKRRFESGDLGDNSINDIYVLRENGVSPNEILKADEQREDIGNPEINDMLLDGKINIVENENNEISLKSREIKNDHISENIPKVISVSQNEDDPHLQEPPREVQESVGVTEHLVAAPIATEVPDPPLDSLEKKVFSDLRDCPTRAQVPFDSQRGDYWILENYIPAAMSFRCDESVTYTTHGDYTFLDNLETLTSRWQVIETYL